MKTERKGEREERTCGKGPQVGFKPEPAALSQVAYGRLLIPVS